MSSLYKPQKKTNSKAKYANMKSSFLRSECILLIILIIISRFYIYKSYYNKLSVRWLRLYIAPQFHYALLLLCGVRVIWLRG